MIEGIFESSRNGNKNQGKTGRAMSNGIGMSVKGLHFKVNDCMG